MNTDDVISFDGHSTIVSLWVARCAEYGERTCHREKKLGIWHAYSWREYYETSKKIGLALLELGVKPCEPVLILAEDRREWLYTDLGAASIGGIPAGVYTTDSAKQLAYLANDSGARVLFVEDDEQLDKWLESADQMPGIEHVIVYEREGLATFSHPKVRFYDELLALGENAPDQDRFEQALQKVRPDDPRMMIYTSGTTGAPKGAILTHRNMVYQVLAGLERFNFKETDEQLCFLPLCHVLERLVSVDAPIANGSTVNFAESPETVFENMQEVSPHTFVGVPRIWEKIYSRVTIMRSDAGPIGVRAYDWAFNTGMRYSQAENPSVGLRLANQLAQWTVLGNLRRMLGLANARRVATGGAPSSPDLIRWYGALGVPMVEAFGMTETGGIATANTVDDNHITTAGKPLPGSELKIDDNGELLIKGPGIFASYWNKPEKTAETFTSDGWLKTGDIGKIDEHGCLTITGRIKDVIITAGGKNITPTEIESSLKFSPYISDAVVIGDQRKYLTCLIMIDQENVEKFAQDRAIPFSDFASLTRAQEVLELIREVVTTVNKDFAQVEQIKDFRLIDLLLTAEDEELTPTMKLKRSFVNERHKALIDDMY
ncbi:AMP-dependent synthetase/ligase [Marinobacterium mangrovicola]|uniref:Long-chain acyl-CoA synthetase n=1 Tax=Marinobacterium mangrovicola TaxID=1476959 RepID=A0A4R1G9E1_9GAMM|nr:AMP-dependent synthetase/ligase [Marinobacterium mangrovicola]TCK04308.1 long-chain acyl-CoA synthetase [Marinobacterium mangrovicola]